MLKPDLLVTQIKHCDYPLFRLWIKKYRHRFGKIIFYFSEHNRFPYFDHYMQSAMKDDDVLFLDPEPTDWGTEDWRNKSTNAMLKYSDSEWVCSVEQDWFCQDWDKVLDIVEEATKTHDLVGWGAKAGRELFYIHPAFWYMKREALEKTRKDFSARDGEDHFGLITRDAEVLGLKIFCIERDGGLNCDPSPDADCFHLGGVNQNYLEGLKEEYVFHREVPFMIYNRETMNLEKEQLSAAFYDWCQKIADKLELRHPEVDLSNNGWTKFFRA